jgi:hypothetical protein
MISHNLANKSQQALLYLLASAALALALYAQLFWTYRPASLPQAPLEVMNSTWQLWLLLLPIPLLVLSAILSYLNSIRACALAFAASLVLLPYVTIEFCAVSVLFFPLLISPLGFVMVILPGLMLYLVMAYSWHVLRLQDQARGLLFWLSKPGEASTITKGIAVVALVASPLYFALETSLRQPTIVQYNMTWSDTSNSHCQHEVSLGFAEAYGYYIRSCSAELLAYLNTTGSPALNVEFLVNYQFGSWKYAVNRVGDWVGTAHFDGLYWSCSGADPLCHPQTARPPLKQPYVLQ